MLTMTAQKLGYPAPTGGASALADALYDRLVSRGGRVECGTPVVRVLVDGGRAWGVRTADGETVRARRAVVADVTAPALYGGLVPWHDLPGRTRSLMRLFRWDPGTIKVDWALSGRVPWAVQPEAEPGTVHIAESLGEVLRFQRDIEAGAVPAKPFLLGGLMATTDPSRAPAGKESMFAYTHVPQHVTSDAGEGGITGRWDHDDTERMADRMQARIEEYAPGFGDLVVARRVLGPRELEARDANLRNGALNGGTAALRQQLVLRPVPGLGGATTPVRQPLPRLHVGPPRRRRPRRLRCQRRPRRPPPQLPLTLRRLILRPQRWRGASFCAEPGASAPMRPQNQAPQRHPDRRTRRLSWRRWR